MLINRKGCNMTQITLSLIFIFFSSMVYSASEGPLGPQVAVECTCSSNMGVITGADNNDIARKCIEKIASSGEEDTGIDLKNCNSDTTSCECFSVHSIYGFGSNRANARSNAEYTCSAVSEQTSKTYSIEECKDGNNTGSAE